MNLVEKNFIDGRYNTIQQCIRRVFGAVSTRQRAI